MAIISAIYHEFHNVRHTLNIFQQEGYPMQHLSIIMSKNSEQPLSEDLQYGSTETVADLLSVNMSTETMVLVTPHAHGIIAMGPAASAAITSNHEILDTLTYIGLPVDRHSDYEKQIRAGSILLVMNTIQDYQLPKIVDILYEQDATQIEVHNQPPASLVH